MKVIGITGGIGSGKTVICRVFSHLGVPVYEADTAAHRLYENEDLIGKIKNKISSEAIDKNGKINRKKLAEIVFNDPEKMVMLNGIVHPAVKIDFDQWAEKNKIHPYVIKEAAILFESGAYKGCDKIVTVTSPMELRIARVRERDHKSKAEIEQIISTQLSDEEKINRSDYVIFNDEKQMVIPQVMKLHGIFQSLIQ
jgi:dephospho-CoA kinase